VASSGTPDDGGGAAGDVLFALRRSSGLSIDDEGRFLVHGEPVTHSRTLEVLWRSLARLPDGTWQVRVGRESALVAVGETPYAVRGAAAGPDGVSLWLSDGTREELRPATLRVGQDGVLRCTLGNGCAARFTRAAQLAVGERLEEDPSAPAGFRLKLGAGSWPIGAE
jgi:hypothetical protein